MIRRKEEVTKKMLRKLYLYFFIVIMLFTIGCASSITGVCRHNAVYCGLVMAEHYPVRIVSGIINSGSRHAQAQVYISGKWQWLKMDGHNVSVGEQEHPFLLDYYSYYDFEDYIKKIRRRGERRVVTH